MVIRLQAWIAVWAPVVVYRAGTGGFFVGLETLELADRLRVDPQRRDGRAVLTWPVTLGVPVGAVMRPWDERAAPRGDDRHVLVAGRHDHDLFLVACAVDHCAQLTDRHRSGVAHSVASPPGMS